MKTNKNLWLIPTDKPSRLYLFEERLILGDLVTVVFKNSGAVNQHIYITSDEEIKDGEYCITKTNEVIRFKKSYTQGFLYKKIILTTDQDLIKEGIQAISDEFLEWFLNNSNCEEVEVEGHIYKGQDETEYKIIIPREEPKYITVKEPCSQCDGTGETTFSGTYNSQRKCDLCNGKGYIDSKDISQMQSDLELIQSLQKPKQEIIKESHKWLNDKFNGKGIEVRIIDWSKNEVNNYSPAKLIEEYAKWMQEQIGKSEFLQRLRGTLSDAEARRLIFETFNK
jgi:hypothetical protein